MAASGRTPLVAWLHTLLNRFVTNLEFVKIAILVKNNKVQYNKMMYAYSLPLIPPLHSFFALAYTVVGSTSTLIIRAECVFC